MKSQSFVTRRVLAVVLLFGVVALLAAVGLPHQHGLGPSQQASHCVACRAQTVQPFAEPLIPLVQHVLLFIGLVLIFSQPRYLSLSFSSSESRAPPVFSL